MTLLMLFHMNSIGFKSGEYGGKYINSIPFSLANSTVTFARCDRKLSRITTILFSGFIALILPRNSHTDSFFEFSLKSITDFPFKAKNPKELARIRVVFLYIVGLLNDHNRCVFDVV